MADHILWVAFGGGVRAGAPREGGEAGQLEGEQKLAGGEAGTPGSEGLRKLQGRQSPA